VDARERYDDLTDFLVFSRDDVALSQMMGMPCVKRGGKMVAGFSGRLGGMVFKLPDEAVRARALALEGAVLFDPSGQGQPFREWVVIPAAHGELWSEFAQHAVTPAG